MALKFKCNHCDTEIISKFLKVGEEAKCKFCGTSTLIPDNAEEVDDNEYDKYTTKLKKVKIAPSVNNDKKPTPSKSSIETPIKDRRGYKGKANSPFFTVVQYAVAVLLACQIIGVLGIGVMIKQSDISLIYGFIVIPILCGVIMLIGFNLLIDVVRALETDMDNLHQEKNNG